MPLNGLEERRVAKRVKFVNPVIYHMAHPDLNGGSIGSDISEGGIRIHFPDFVPVGTNMMLRIELANNRLVDIQAQIAWIEKDRYSERYHAGLKFDIHSLDGITQKQIQAMVEKIDSSA